jgi:hypothetical protein
MHPAERIDLMNLKSTVRWLTETPLSQTIQTTSWAIPGIQVVHIICLAALFAFALNLSLRVAGRGLAVESLASLAGRLVPAIWTCIGILFLSGSLLIIAEPFRTITNPVFYLKMGLLIVAIMLTLRLNWVARHTSGTPSGAHTAVAILSMLAWAGIIVAGRFIAYV